MRAQFKWGVVSWLQSLHVGGLRKELHLDSEEEDGWSEEGARPLFDVCGFVGMVGMVGYLWP